MSVYRVLPAHLHSTAAAAAKYLSSQLGIPAGSIKIEAEINPSVDFRPTLHAINSEKHFVCVEVIEKLYPPEINSFVLSCKNHSIPAKLYCAIPAGAVPHVDVKALKFASENGVSILEVNPVSGESKLLNQPPVPLSLGGLRDFKLTAYPPKYRAPLRSALDTFRGGNPVKGCSEVYDELEQLSRKIGKKCQSIPDALSGTTSIDWEKGAWHTILESLKARINPVKAGTPLLKGQLLSRIIGMTEYRNETGHKPSSVQKRIDRDIELKTRFESAMDDLLKLVEAAKPLKV